MGVQVHEFPNGDVAIGVEIEGAFVPFASHSAGRLAQYVQRGKALAERADNGDELARDQLGKPIGSGDSDTKPISKLTSAELDEYANENEVEDFPYDGNVAEKRAAAKDHEAAQEEES